ncbi:MAG: sarcosine oxidase subunit gamma family protein [Pseudomonadota bacterium]
MANIFQSAQIVPGKAASPLAASMKAGTYAAENGAAGVQIHELFGRAICEMAAWHDTRSNVRRLIPKGSTAIEIAPSRWLIITEDQAVPAKLSGKIGDKGTVVDLSHGRTILKVSGAQSVWVLSKLFAIDFATMPLRSGLATSHHGITAQIWHEAENTFQIIIFRSLAESFFEALKAASSDVGYEIA